MDDLFKAILNVQHKQRNSQGREFASDVDVRGIMNRDNVRKALQDKDAHPKHKLAPEHIDDAADIIVSRAPRVFAILVLIHCTKFILHFVENDYFQTSIIDQGLPFDRQKLFHILKDDSVVTQFFEKQWSFAAPVFSDSVFARVLPRETILPFIENCSISEGNFGVVSVIKIPPSHQLFVRNSSPVEVRHWADAVERLTDSNSLFEKSSNLARQRERITSGSYAHFQY